MFILGDSMADDIMLAIILWLGAIILCIIHFFLCFIRRSRLVIYSFICIWTPPIFIIFGVPKLKEMERVRIASVVCQMHASVMDELEAKSQFTINEKIIFSDDKILYEAEHGSKLADRNNKSIAEWKDNSMRQYISSDCNAPKYTKIPSKFPKLIKFIG